MKKGILIVDGHNSKYFILGAGNALGNGGDDFKWAGGWNIYKKNMLTFL
ncbi:MAG: hypothetical protein JST19_03315 [Bacteroidetes bacterium]|nr:hypothetical protein [Bacteroidota bacterium]